VREQTDILVTGGTGTLSVSAALHQARNQFGVAVPGGNVKRRSRPSRELGRSLERVTSVHRFAVGK